MSLLSGSMYATINNSHSTHLRKNMAAPLLIKIQRWLMQAHVWRFVGLASTVVGLLSYALSSSSRNLLGGWNLLKIVVYSVVSITVCFGILFPKVWQHSRSHRFKAHMAFSILTITAVYSFFFDKAVNGKPDAYSLISCAAFAVMSLSLSRQSTPCGFEVDLLYFFLGALIVQFMRIKLLLGVIGVGFSYSLIILRSFLSDNEHLRFQDQYHLVVQVDSNPQQEANIDIALIAPQLNASIGALKTSNSKLIDMLSKYLNQCIRTDTDSNYMDHISVDNNLVIDTLDSDIIDNLHEAVKLMMASGFEKECCDVYSSCRSECLEECLNSLRHPYIEQVVEIGTISYDYEIRLWIRTCNVAMRFLFPNERRLCERIFLGFTAAGDLAFTKACREFMIRQLNFANSYFAAWSTIFKSSEILPIISIAFKTLDDLIPEYESLSSESSNDLIRSEAINTWQILEKATQDIFKELEDWICHDIAMADLPGGLYPISCDVMNCLSGVCEAWNTLGLEKVFQEHPMFARREGTSSSFSTRLIRIIELLDSHLEVKSKKCIDPVLRCVFMVNNRRYIKQKTREHRLRTIFPNGWIKKLNARVEQNIIDYQRTSWDMVIRLLKPDDIERETIKSMKGRIKMFNRHFKEIYRVQSTWFILDEQLRKEIRESIKKILWPAYGDFTTMLKNILNPNEYIAYSLHDIDFLLIDLFRGRN